MAETPIPESEFRSLLLAAVQKNMANEQFGVSELAEQLSMSRSNLLRKVKKETGLSVSQFINQVRLAHAMELLRTTGLNVSEVSEQVGFNSPSYFIKCFREYFGYPPGEVGKRKDEETVPQVGMVPETNVEQPRRSRKLGIGLLGVALLGAVILVYVLRPTPGVQQQKSIAVLPFKNESSDSTNIYIINGLMDATLNNLVHIRDLSVISRTTAEKYRNTSKSIPELSVELGVRYFIEGSGQKIGDRIVLNIQLIDGATDKHLWSRQYRRESKDIFELQEEIAKNIADEIEIVLTPEEQQVIGRKPTEDVVAYDYYLRAKDLFFKSKRSDLLESIPLFQKAIERDPEFALAYAHAAMVFYYLDIFQIKKEYVAQLEEFADKAVLFDANSSESLIAKGLSYAAKGEFEQAVLYLERALAFNPKSGLVLHFLTEFYSVNVPNPGKYIEYAARKVKVDINTDSATNGFNYFHLANAQMQCGFFDEAYGSIEKSLAYDPRAYFAGYVRAYILFGKDFDLKKLKQRLQAELDKDSMRFDIIQEIAKVSYQTKDYEGAFRLYNRFLALRSMLQLKLYESEELKIGIVYEKMGKPKEAQAFINNYLEFAKSYHSVYRPLLLAFYDAYKKDTPALLEHLREFQKRGDFVFWVIYLDDEPVFEPYRDNPEFAAIMADIRARFWSQNKQIRERMKELGLM